MEQQRCGQCQYYIPHYILTEEGKLVRIYCGHCVNGRPKNKKPNRKSCEEFREGTNEPYVTKQYLRIALLKKILEMELLPENLDE